MGLDLTAWTWWWEFNREPFLVLPDRRNPLRPGTGDLLGRAPGTPSGGSPVTDASLFGQVVPGLLRTLDQDETDALTAAAAIALGRIGASRPQAARSAYAEALTARLAGASQALRESLVLSLGILAADASAPELAGVLLSTREARESLGTTRIGARTRAGAALALGLLGRASENQDVRRYVVHQLVWCLETDRTASLDLESACVIALGLVSGESAHGANRRGPDAPPGSSLEAQVDYLIALLNEGRRSDQVRAQVPTALGRLLGRATGPGREELRLTVLEELIERIAAHRREPREVIQSCVLALGQLADADADDMDRRVRRHLVRMEDLVNDLPARQYALIALGRACGRAGPGRADPLRDEIDYLMRELGRGSTLMRPWASLGLALGTRNAQDPKRDVQAALRDSLGDARADHLVGAYGLAVGLSRDTEGIDGLLSELGERGDPATRGRLALALGLTGGSAPTLPLLKLVPGTLFQPQLLHDAAVGLQLIGAGESVPLLVELLGNASSFSSKAAVSMALARSKDDRAALPLLRLLGDEQEPDRLRAVAAAALGHLGDREDVPWHAHFAVSLNIHAAPAILFSPAGDGILNRIW